MFWYLRESSAIASRGYSPAETCVGIFHAFSALLTSDVPADSTCQISLHDERVREDFYPPEDKG